MKFKSKFHEIIYINFIQKFKNKNNIENLDIKLNQIYVY